MRILCGDSHVPCSAEGGHCTRGESSVRSGWLGTVSRTRRNQRRAVVKESRPAHSSLAGSPEPPLPSACPGEQVGTTRPKVPARGVRAQNRWPRGGHSAHSPSPMAPWPCRHRAWHRAHGGNGSPAGKTARTSRCTGSRVGTYHPHGSSPWSLQAGLRGWGRGGERKREQEGRNSVPHTVGAHPRYPTGLPLPVRHQTPSSWK